jgi:hypothetical protein
MVLSVRTPSASSYRVRPQISDDILSERTKAMDWLWAELPALVDEVIAAVQEAVPEYHDLAATAEGGIRQALEGFVERAEGRRPARTPVREVSVRFGRDEARRGRPIEALLRAYRVGAQTAWRGLSEAGDRAGLEPRVLYSLAERIFAYIDEISAASAEGYAYQQSLAAGEQQERRRRLVEALLADPQPPPDEIERAARAAGWELPERMAVLAFEPDAAERVTARLPAPAIVAGTYALVPDADGPGRHDELRLALGDFAGALGPTVAWQQAAESERRARLALEAVPPRDGDPLAVADEHMLDLVLASDPDLVHSLARRRLAPLDDLPPGQRERLVETLRAWLDAQGEARPAAERLHVHVQTVRYRIGRLREVLGDALDDPDGRLELALALRVGGA